MHAFEAETRFAERANTIVQQQDTSVEEMRREYRHIAQQYSVLLNEVMKITRVSDATQTELRRTRKELFVALQQAEIQRSTAEHLNDQKTEILSIAAHDLKNPLASIMGLVDILRSRITDNNDSKEILDVIYDAAERMLGLIQNILSNSAIDLGKIQPTFADCDFLSVLAEVILANTTRSQQKQQNVSFNNETTSACIVNGDMQLLYELCDNIISNAIKYSPVGSNITINLTFVQKENKATHHDQKYIQFDVIDQGPGLSEDDKTKLFGYFQRLSAKPTGGESSNGLGLAVAKRITEIHEGEIWAESKKDEGIPGTTFFVTIPLKEQ